MQNRKMVGIGVILAGLVMLLTVGVTQTGKTAGAASPATATEIVAQKGETGPPIANTSGPAELGLARHLKQTGARLYGAYWCPHCHEQLELFGQQAARLLPYIECDPKGQNPRTQVCRDAKIKGFPTWDIRGKRYAGTQSLEELAKAAGYKGNRKFKNVL